MLLPLTRPKRIGSRRSLGITGRRIRVPLIANFETYAFQKERESSTVATPEIIKASHEGLREGT